MITTLPRAYLRIVCVKINNDGKVSVQQLFSASGEKIFSTNFFYKNKIRLLHKRKKSPEKTGQNQSDRHDLSLDSRRLSDHT
jgi:hypothetical protein